MNNNPLNTPKVICYLCGIVDDKIKAERSIEFNNSAAENKVLGICDALKSRVKYVVAVSSGRGGGPRSAYRFPAVARRVSHVSVLYAAFWHNPFLSHIVTVFSLIMLLLRLKKLARGMQMCLIAYNRKWIYIPMLCVARILGVRCYLDLEDAPAIRDSGVFHHFVAWFEAKVIDGLCNQGALVASSLLLDKLYQKHKLVCHGVAYQREGVPLKNPEDVNFVRILFGGFLSIDTGAQLLIDAVRILEREHKDISGRIHIVVTGHGPLLEAFQELSLSNEHSLIDYRGKVAFATYQSLLAEVDVGLCLKLPSSDMCSTTFPSKVVEYASFGKAVLSTGIKDVASLFGEDGAYLLQDESVDSLVKMIRKIALEPEQVRVVAEMGQRRLIAKSGREAVADNIMNLLTGDKAMARVIIDWQCHFTEHQSHTWLAAQQFFDEEITHVVAKTSNGARKSQGWLDIDLSAMKTIPFNKKGWWKQSVGLFKKYPGAVHVFGGFWADRRFFPLILYALRCGNKVVVLNESYATSPVAYQNKASHWRNQLNVFLRPRLYRLAAWMIHAISKPHQFCLLALSASAAKQFEQAGFLHEQVFPFGYFVPKQHVAVEEAAKSETVRVVFVGSLIKRKGLDLLVRAVEKLYCEGVQIELHVFGHGNPADYINPQSEAVKYKGTIPFGEAQTVIVEYDALVLPSLHDGWGVVVNEALLQGVPVIVSSDVGAKCMIECSGAGMVFESGNFCSLHQTLEAFISSPKLRIEQTQNAESMSKLITPENAAKHMTDVFDFYFKSKGERPKELWKTL